MKKNPPAQIQPVEISFTDREMRLIINSLDYATGDPAGLPGHNLMVIIAKMAAALKISKSDISEALMKQKMEAKSEPQS